jgi:8-amino-7-oxononanoate synthase
MLGLKQLFVHSKSAIQSAIIPGNENVTFLVKKFQEKGFDVKATFAPTAPEGQERLRFCLHSFNSIEQISEVLRLFAVFICRFKRDSAIRNVNISVVFLAADSNNFDRF